MSTRRAVPAALLAAVALLAALWFLAIAPKRSEQAAVSANVAKQQARLDTARAQVMAFTATRERFPALVSKLRRLDKAVPSRGAVSSLLRQLQRRARVRGAELRLVALKEGAAAAPGAGTASATPGAVAGPGGLATLPFTFEYTGRYYDLLEVLETVRRAVRLKRGELRIDGRLLTIDGLVFKRLSPGKPLTKAIVNATAYIAPDTAAALKTPVAAGQPAATEGS